MTTPRISLLLPTHGRPTLAQRFIDSVEAQTREPGRVEIVAYVDDDDAASHHLDSRIISFTRIIGPRTTMGGFNSACYARARGDIIILANDDLVIRTRRLTNFNRSEI